MTADSGSHSFAARQERHTLQAAILVSVTQNGAVWIQVPVLRDLKSELLNSPKEIRRVFLFKGIESVTWRAEFHDIS